MPARLTTAQAQEIFRKAGAEPLFTDFRGTPEKHPFRCACGAEGEVIFSTVTRKLGKVEGYKLECFDCGRRKGAPKHTTESVRALFLFHGAEPLFEAYGRLDTPLKYRCACGNEKWVSVESVVEGIRLNPDHVIRCQSCAHEGYVPPSKQAVLLRFDEAFTKHGAVPLDPYPGNNHTPIRFRCKCGKEHQMVWLSLEQGSAARCPECHYENRPRGETHGCWNPELTDEDRAASTYGRGAEFQAWASAVKVRDKFTCQVSGQVGGSLHAHHLNNWADFPALRLELSNGITISEELHRQFHARYGRDRNTAAQFAEFCKLLAPCSE